MRNTSAKDAMMMGSIFAGTMFASQFALPGPTLDGHTVFFTCLFTAAGLLAILQTMRKE